jgi:hypothetical protein
MSSTPAVRRSGHAGELCCRSSECRCDDQRAAERDMDFAPQPMRLLGWNVWQRQIRCSDLLHIVPRSVSRVVLRSSWRLSAIPEQPIYLRSALAAIRMRTVYLLHRISMRPPSPSASTESTHYGRRLSLFNICPTRPRSIAQSMESRK